MDAFTNQWWALIASNYTVTIGIIGAIVCFSVNFLAIIDPKIPSNKIIDLFKSYWPGVRKDLPMINNKEDDHTAILLKALKGDTDESGTGTSTSH
jgi:hypothetical protein